MTAPDLKTLALILDDCQQLGLVRDDLADPQWWPTSDAMTVNLTKLYERLRDHFEANRETDSNRMLRVIRTTDTANVAIHPKALNALPPAKALDPHTAEIFQNILRRKGGA